MCGLNLKVFINEEECKTYYINILMNPSKDYKPTDIEVNLSNHHVY